MDSGDHRRVSMMRAAVASFVFLTSTRALASDEVVHVYTSLDPVEMQTYTEAFEARTKIRVRWVRLSSGEVLTRIRAERARPQASVWFGGSSAEFSFGAAEGLLEPHRPRTFDALRPEAHDAEWRWVGMSESLIGFASNPRVLAEEGAHVPRAWRDLLAPQYRGLIGVAYAYTSGTAYTIIASQAQLFGEEAAVEYWKALDKNVHHYNRSGSACVTQVGLGEIGTCVAFTNDILNKGVKKGYGIVMTFPEEGAAFEIDSIALIKGAPEEELGRRFIDWVLDLEAQKLLAAKHRIPMRADAGPGADLPSSDVKRIAFSSARAAKDRLRLVELWREATGQ